MPASPPLVSQAGPTAPGDSLALAPPARDDGRLPSEVRPTRYALDLTIDPTRPTFDGRVWIAVTIDRPIHAVVLHGRGLKVREAAFGRATRRIAERARQCDTARAM